MELLTKLPVTKLNGNNEIKQKLTLEIKLNSSLKI